MNSDVIKKLSEVEHILQRPGMYIGSVSSVNEEQYLFVSDKLEKNEINYVPAVLTCFNEIISNSIDEFQKTDGKFGTKINITMTDTTITVDDNGRGLSSTLCQHTKLPQSVLAFTHPRAGSNFGNSSTSIGQNGIGAWGVACFSKIFNVQTSDGIEKTTIKIENNLSKYDYKLTKNKRRFTTVTYKLDFDRFGIAKYEDIYKKIIEKRVLDLSICFPDITFTLNKSKLTTKNVKEYSKLYSENIESFSFENIDISIFPNDGFDQISFVNGINTIKGGTHCDYIILNIISPLRDLLSKRYKDIKPIDIKNKLAFIINVRNFNAPRFDSQKKECLISSFNKSNVSDIDFDKIVKKINSNKEMIGIIVETYKIKEELKKREELKKKEKKTLNIDMPKLIETNHPIIEERSIYIAEGDSALSNFLLCRDETQAAFPLSGKVTNSTEKNGTELSKSKKVMNLCTALGLKLSSKKIDDLQYGKIVIFTDADFDGDSIACLLINLFCDRWPDLIREGRVYKSLSPLIYAENIDTKEKKYFFDNKSYHETEGNWKILNYNKGLGSLSEEEYKFSLNNLVQIVWDDDADKTLEIAFGKDSTPRKEWMKK